jgi:hypothetical protein
VLARDHTSGAAAGEGFLYSIGTRNDFVAFEKLNRQEWNLDKGFYSADIGMQEIAEFTVYLIVLVLETKHFKRGLLELLLGGDGEYVGNEMQGALLVSRLVALSAKVGK